MTLLTFDTFDLHYLPFEIKFNSPCKPCLNYLLAVSKADV